MCIKVKLKKGIDDALRKCNLEVPEYNLEFTPEGVAGDFATNVALILGSKKGKSPMEIAETICRSLQEAEADIIDKIEIAKPGFINLFVREDLWYNELERILRKGKKWGRTNIGKGEKVLIEFVSANPTGPLHIGHGRCAAIGDSLANILEATGYRVVREYYVNDVGNQIDLLEESIRIRERELRGEKVSFPEGAYMGDYIRELAREIQSVLQRKGNIDYKYYAVRKILKWIEKDLEDFGVRFDGFFFESDLYKKKKVEEAIQYLRSRNLIYERDGAVWFKSSLFGDEKDRVVTRENGRPTYFASDIAYHFDKFKRGFDKLINVWGADHHGYVDRIRASLMGLGMPPERVKIILYQLVSLLREGRQVSMSTRRGEFVTLREVMDEVGKDAMRFFLLMRGADSDLDFDLELAKKQSPENPVYYVQYAHARICSIFREKSKGKYKQVKINEESEAEKREFIEIIKWLSVYPEIVEKCSRRFEPHHLTGYLLELAKRFHHYYDRYRILSKDRVATKFRVKMVKAVRTVIGEGLRLLGVSAPERM